MNTNKKLIYAIVCALALQAVVPAQANIWSSVVNWWNHVPEQSKRTAGIVAASVTALLALTYSAYALCKKNKKAVVMPKAPGAVNMAQEPAAPVVNPVSELAVSDVAFMPVFAGVTEEELKQRRDVEQRVQREREEARAGLAQSAMRQQNALRQLQEEEKKTAAQKAAEVVAGAGQTAANGVYRVATSPTVVNGLSAAGSTLAQSASAVASATGSAVTTVATGALNMMQYVTRESTPAFNRIAQIYDDVYVPFKKRVYDEQVIKYRTRVEQQDFEGAFGALEEIKKDYMRAINPLFEEITTLRRAHEVKLRNVKSLVGYSEATIRSESARLTELANAVSAIPAFVATECQELERQIGQRKLAKRQRSEGESKRKAA